MFRAALYASLLALTQTIVPPHAKGVVVDDVSGAPIAGATVIVSGVTLIEGATPPPATEQWPSSTTAADGTFDVKGIVPTASTMDFSSMGPGYPIYRHAQWIEIFSPDGHAAYHGIWSINAAGATNLGIIAVAKPSPADKAWLSQINSDRAKIGVPAVTFPLAFDSVTLESARYWAEQMASSAFFSHECPPGRASCKPFELWQTEHHSWPSSQNIAWNQPTWTLAEQQFMSEIRYCSDGGNWDTCSYAQAGHYINIMSATSWAGVASAAVAQGSAPYYVENFTSPEALAPHIKFLHREPPTR